MNPREGESGCMKKRGESERREWRELGTNRNRDLEITREIKAKIE